MRPSDKIQFAVRDLRSRGVWAGSAAPPIFQLIWLLGFHVPPPYFLSFGRLVLFMGTGFGVFWPPCVWLGRGGSFGHPLGGTMAIEATVAGAGFGVLMAAYCRLRARQLKLPSWSDYEPDAPGSSTT
jgi:membrane associated rhomboid family serine protease